MGGGDLTMFMTAFIILLILWALGFVAFHVGSFIHILLVLALISIVLHLVRGRSPVV